MNTPQEEIIALLSDYQGRNRLNDIQMAARLGIAPSSWSLFRRGERQIPRTSILVGFVKLFHRRAGLVRDFFDGEVAEENAGDEA